MHPYVIDTDERTRVTMGIACIAILLAWAWGQMQIYYKISVPWWFDTPAVIGFFGLLYKLIDKYLWNTSILQRFGFFRTPDLNGKWLASIESSHNGFSQPITAEIIIKQTWTNMVIVLKTDHSRSVSRVASIFLKHPGQPLMSYEYLNEPDANAPAALHMHYGFTRLQLSNDLQTLTGDYFTGRDRENRGLIRLEKQLQN